MKKLFIPLCMLPSLAFGQWYAGANFGYMPQPANTGYVTGQLLIGHEIAGVTFLEYSQVIALSVQARAAQMFQIRSGIMYDCGKLTFKPFVGTSLTSAPANESKKAALGLTAGLQVIQRLKGRAIQVRYEVGISNNGVFTPSVGFQFNL